MTSGPRIVVHPVPVERVYGLRHAVLRAGLPAEAARFEHDDAGVHWAALSGGRVVGCATVHRASFDGPGFVGVPAWRLRGMAVDPSLQRGGVGGQLLRAAEAHVARSPTPLLWCHARLPAVGFYERAGWTAAGDVYDIPTAGPHRKMHKRLDAPPSGPTIAATF